MLHPRAALKIRYSFTDFLFYSCLLAVPLFTAVLAIFKHSTGWTAAFLLVAAAMTALILRYFCTHCPHYGREEKNLTCIFFWRLPKYFSARPGKPGNLDKVVSFGAVIILLFFPLHWLLLEPGLLIVCLLSLAGFGAAVYRQECRRCIFFDCPANRVSVDMKHQAPE